MITQLCTLEPTPNQDGLAQMKCDVRTPVKHYCVAVARGIGGEIFLRDRRMLSEPIL